MQLSGNTINRKGVVTVLQPPRSCHLFSIISVYQLVIRLQIMQYFVSGLQWLLG